MGLFPSHQHLRSRACRVALLREQHSPGTRAKVVMRTHCTAVIASTCERTTQKVLMQQQQEEEEEEQEEDEEEDEKGEGEEDQQ